MTVVCVVIRVATTVGKLGMASSHRAGLAVSCWYTCSAEAEVPKKWGGMIRDVDKGQCM